MVSLYWLEGLGIRVWGLRFRVGVAAKRFKFSHQIMGI